MLCVQVCYALSLPDHCRFVRLCDALHVIQLVATGYCKLQKTA